MVDVVDDGSGAATTVTAWFSVASTDKSFSEDDDDEDKSRALTTATVATEVGAAGGAKVELAASRACCWSRVNSATILASRPLSSMSLLRLSNCSRGFCDEQPAAGPALSADSSAQTTAVRPTNRIRAKHLALCVADIFDLKKLILLPSG